VTSPAGELDRTTDQVLAHVSRDRLLSAVLAVTSVPSPTGGEATLAHLLVEHLKRAGVPAQAQHLDALQANAVGTLRGTGSGPSLMLYSPIDTLTTGTAEQDVPWIGPRLRTDMLAEPVVHGDLVEGLGASNPKGHAACVLVAVQALAASGVTLGGEVVAAFGAGGMPTFAVPGAGTPGRENTGHGAGCSFLLERGHVTDAAVIAKPGWGVSHEEVGLVWFDVVVPGTHTYVGSRHRLPYANPVVLAADVALRLERWLADYPARHAYGTMLPQGIMGAVIGGWERMVAVTPAAVRLRVDLRITPLLPPAAARREFAAAVARIGDELGLALEVEMVAAIPASSTNPQSDVVRATVEAWEHVAGESHVPLSGGSGATDANILRGRGVPTARIGMPKVTRSSCPDEPIDFARGMNTVDLREMHRLVHVLVRTALALTVEPSGGPDDTGST